ncbi:MAG: hypothetical protein J2P28_08525 [Actinobacteria bacterium]|nr:hypothetical protein [Actinomycetota bacterium]
MSRAQLMWPLIRAQADQFPGIIAATSDRGPNPEDSRLFGLARILDGLELLMSAGR